MPPVGWNLPKENRSSPWQSTIHAGVVGINSLANDGGGLPPLPMPSSAPNAGVDPTLTCPLPARCPLPLERCEHGVIGAYVECSALSDAEPSLV